MYSEKDNCCFCIPLGFATILIGFTVGFEILTAFSSGSYVATLVQLFLGATFLLTACNQKSYCFRMSLAYIYAVIFGLYLLIISGSVYKFFLGSPPQSIKLCEAFEKSGKLDEEITVNICALYVNQKVMLWVLLYGSYSFTLKSWFSYILFKYANQIKAQEEQKEERKETVKQVLEMQEIPVAAEEALP